MTLSIPEYDVLVRFALPATPKIKEALPFWTDLQRRGLLSIKPVDRHLIRVETTDAGMLAVRETEGRR